MASRKTLNRRWKAVELAVAKFWGAKRAHFEAFDTTHPVLNIEVKCRERAPSVKLREWLQQAEDSGPRTAAGWSAKVPLVHLHIVGEQHDDDIIIMRATNLKYLLVSKGVIDDPQ